MRRRGTEIVTDPDDPRIADFADLTDATARRAVEGSGGHGLFIVEGVITVGQLLASDYPVRSVLLTPARAESLGDLVAAVPDDVPVLVAERSVLRAVTGFNVHRGVLASADRMALPTAEQLLSAHDRVVVVSRVNDHENLGALFRTSAALGIGAVLVDDQCADPLYRRAVRVSLGHVLHLPHARVGAVLGAFDAIRSTGHRIVALTPRSGSVKVDAAAAQGILDDPVAFVIGPEGPGLDEAVIDAADHAVAIPMAPGVDSLNVATSLGVVAAFAAARRGWAV
ncbi:MAG: TrmH family RNA methyltransferase [Acidimicrobiales bacterium]